MKKYISLIMCLAVILSLTTYAFAFGPGFGWGGGGGFCWLGNIPPEQTQKYTDFQKQILPLRQKMIELKTDLATLYSQANPDWNAIASKQKEIVDLRIEIQKRAYTAGLSLRPFYMQNVKGKMGMRNCAMAPACRMI